MLFQGVGTVMAKSDLVAAGIQPERIRYLNKRQPRQGEYVLYWMQASQRASYNHALEYAIYAANELNLPLVTWFGLTDDFPEANARHYHFMLEGLCEVKKGLAERGIGMCITRGNPREGVIRMGEKAALTVTDSGYLRVQREWRRQAAKKLTCPLVQVESDIVAPVEQASGKEEYSAATLRPKMKRLLYKYLVPLKEGVPLKRSINLPLSSEDINDPGSVVARLKIDHNVKRSGYYTGGQGEASRRLALFLDKLDRYPQ